MTPALERLMRMRDRVDCDFLEYAETGKVLNNLAALSQLALIGGRLDTLIRRQIAHDRKWHKESR